jgi:hypothetical protein
MAVERDSAAAEVVTSFLTGPNQRFVVGTRQPASQCLSDGCFWRGHAVDAANRGEGTNAEATRLMAPGARFGMHELSYTSVDVAEPRRQEIQRELSQESHVGVWF